MKTLINSNAKLDSKFLKLLMKLPPDRFFGVTTILGIHLSEKEKDNLARLASRNEEDKEVKDTAEETKDMTEENQNKNKENMSIEDETAAVEEDKAIGVKEDKEEDDEEIRDPVGLIFLAVNKFKELNLQQKKNLVKIMKAGV